MPDMIELPPVVKVAGTWIASAELSDFNLRSFKRRPLAEAYVSWCDERYKPTWWDWLRRPYHRCVLPYRKWRLPWR